MKNTNTLEKKVDLIAVNLDRLTNKVEDLAVTTKKDIEDLAISVSNGFNQMVTKEVFEERMDQIDDRFDRIENVSIGNHERRIENIEDDIRVIKTKVGLKKAP